MSTETDEETVATLAQKLQEHVRNRRQVEAALELDPADMDLIQLEADLSELILFMRRKFAAATVEKLNLVDKSSEEKTATDAKAKDQTEQAPLTSSIEDKATTSVSTMDTSNNVALQDSNVASATPSSSVLDNPPAPVIPVLEPKGREPAAHAGGVVRVEDVSDHDLLHDWFRIRHCELYKDIRNQLRKRRGQLRGQIFKKLDPNYVYAKNNRRKRIRNNDISTPPRPHPCRGQNIF